MTKEEAIEAMKKGYRVTHRFFSTNEWMTIRSGTKMYEFEDECICSPQLFWFDRKGPEWNIDWEIYNDI
jgi:hypothetical protein